MKKLKEIILKILEYNSIEERVKRSKEEDEKYFKKYGHYPLSIL